jgi:hypothetical protein
MRDRPSGDGSPYGTHDSTGLPTSPSVDNQASAVPGPGPGAFRKLRMILRIPVYGWTCAALSLAYFMLVMIAFGDLSAGGRGFEFLSVPLDRMFDRTGTFTFEPVARVTVPGVTLLLSPINLGAVGLLSLLAGMNLTVVFASLREPQACRLSRTGSVLSGIPALLAGGACCAPAILLVLGLQASSLVIGLFQILIPVSFVLLAGALKLALDRTNVDQFQA